MSQRVSLQAYNPLMCGTSDTALDCMTTCACARVRRDKVKIVSQGKAATVVFVTTSCVESRHFVMLAFTLCCRRVLIRKTESRRKHIVTLI